MERTRVELGILAKGRKVLEGVEAYQLRESQVHYRDVLIQKMPILAMKTVISGTLILIFQYDSLVRPIST